MLSFISFALLITNTVSLCLTVYPSLQTQLDYHPFTLIGRFTPFTVDNNPVLGMLPCEIEVNDQESSAYSNFDKAPLYTVEEVFQGDESLVGSVLPIVWDTDTGYRHELPSYVYDKEEDKDGTGFLGFVTINGDCYDESEESPIQRSDVDSKVFSMSECTVWNKPWSVLTENDMILLGSDMVAAPSSAPSTASSMAGTSTSTLGLNAQEGGTVEYEDEEFSSTWSMLNTSRLLLTITFIHGTFLMF